MDVSSPKTRPAVAVILVNFNGIDDTRECLESLAGATYPNLLPIVVDNASKNGEGETLRREFPDIEILLSPENLGFSGGNNLAIERAWQRGAEHIFLLNNDTTVAPNFLEPLVDTMLSDPKIGACGSLVFYHGESETVWTYGGIIDSRGQAYHVGQNEPFATVVAREGSPRDVDYIIGCALLLRGETLKQVGLLDDDYFLYYEDSDLGARIRARGWRSVTVAESRIWHKVSRSSGVDSPLTFYYMRRNRLLYLKKNAGLSSLLVAMRGDIVLWLKWAVRRRPRRRVLWRAFFDFQRGVVGKVDPDLLRELDA